MNIEILNNFTGDNLVQIDTDSDEGKKKVAELFNSMLRAGTAIFLERAGETYRVTGYDVATDALKVQVPVAQPAGKPCGCHKCECSNTVRESSRTGVCVPCQQSRHRGKRIETKARPKFRDRVTAIAPRAGG